MEHRENNGRERDLLIHVGNCSKNMIKHHDLDNLSEFVMHDLCCDKGFGLAKAAYLVHNPDFACIKGVAGYHKPEAFEKECGWDGGKSFTSHMKKAPFNQHVRRFSHTNQKELSDKKIKEMVDFLEIVNPAYHIWDAKHNNQGIFIFERYNDDALVSDHLYHFLHMLSFCPVF